MGICRRDGAGFYFGLGFYNLVWGSTNMPRLPALGSAGFSPLQRPD